MRNTRPISDFHQACQDVIDLAKGQYAGYAQQYAKAGLRMGDRHAIKLQALYILTNLTHWQGQDARHAKAALRDFASDVIPMANARAS